MIDTARLQEIMQQRGYGVAELAARAGLDAGSVSRIVRGADARSSSLYKIADALGTTTDYLLGRQSSGLDALLDPGAREILIQLNAEEQRMAAAFASFYKSKGFPTGDDGARAQQGELLTTCRR